MKRLAVLASAVLIQGCAGLLAWDERGSAAPARIPDDPAEGPRPSRPLGPSEHFVKKGDTLYSIAFRNSLDFRDVARWNNIGKDYLIFPGEILRLTPPPVPPAPPIQTDDIESRGMPMDHELAAPKPVMPDSPPPSDVPPVDPASASGSATAVASIKPLPGEIVEPTGFAWTWPTNGVVLRGYAPNDGSKGLDFTGTEGQPVFAAAPGRVVYSGNALKGYGELIIIKHDDIHLSAYGYNRRRHVREGDIVTAGQPIGEMGLGPENRPLLHFEIRERGKATNPAKLLPAKSG